MKVVMVAVTSLDGKLTKGNDPKISEWTSRQDQEFFSAMLHKNNLMVMGRRTYEVVKKGIKLRPGKLRIVLTKDFKKYRLEEISGQLEFTEEAVGKLVKRLADKGYKNLLLLGGGEIYNLFLREKLVDELYLTVEPKIFGSGRSLAGNLPLDISLRLINLKKLSNQGTLLLHYQVKNDN